MAVFDCLAWLEGKKPILDDGRNYDVPVFSGHQTRDLRHNFSGRHGISGLSDAGRTTSSARSSGLGSSGAHVLKGNIRHAPWPSSSISTRTDPGPGKILYPRYGGEEKKRVFLPKTVTVRGIEMATRNHHGNELGLYNYEKGFDGAFNLVTYKPYEYYMATEDEDRPKVIGPRGKGSGVILKSQEQNPEMRTFCKVLNSDYARREGITIDDQPSKESVLEILVRHALATNQVEMFNGDRGCSENGTIFQAF